MPSHSKLQPTRSHDWIPILWLLIIALIWLVFWFAPWQTNVKPFIELRLGIALLLFIVPGICTFALLLDRFTITLSHLIFGFVISHLAIALLGTLGRYFHLSFVSVKLLMALLGVIPIFFYALQSISNGPRLKIKSDEIVPLAIILLVSCLTFLIVIQRVLTSDDLSYLAYLTNWKNSPRLDFNDIIFNQSQWVHPRFWFMSVPFAQALLANLSNLPGILILGGYYEPFLVILAVLCWYELAKTAGFSPRAASASVLMQLAFLLLLSEYLHPGAPFYTQLSTDKATAAFILAPAFFQSLILLLKRPDKSRMTLFLLTGLSLSFTHPVILAYAVFIVGVMVLFNLKKFGLTKLIVPLLILIPILLPQIALRFANIETQGSIPFSSADIFDQRDIGKLILRWRDTQFYGFNPASLDMTLPFEERLPLPAPFIHKGWLILPILSALFALKRVKNDFAAQYIFASFLLCLLAAIPFTGWIIGYFLSAWMLERALWLYPFGLGVVFLCVAIGDTIKTKMSIKVSKNLFLTSATVIVIAIFSLYLHENGLPDFEKFTTKSLRYQNLALSGQALDTDISDHAYVMGSPTINDLIPGLSSKAKLITFRISDPANMPYFTPAERDARIADTALIFSKSTEAAKKLSLLEKYDLRFLVLQRDDLILFKKLIERYPDRIKATEVGGVIIIKISGSD